MTGVIPFLIFLNTQWANFIKDTPKDVQYTPEPARFWYSGFTEVGKIKNYGGFCLYGQPSIVSPEPI